MLGIPSDVVAATEHLLALATDWHPRAVDLGKVGDRALPLLRRRRARRQRRRARRRAPASEGSAGRVLLRVGGDRDLLPPLPDPPTLCAELVDIGAAPTASPCWSRTPRPTHTSASAASRWPQGVSLDSGDLAGLILKRTSPLDIPSVAWRALSSHAKVSGHRQIHEFTAAEGLRFRSLDDRELPVQVDGDFIGTAAESRRRLRWPDVSRSAAMTRSSA